MSTEPHFVRKFAWRQLELMKAGYSREEAYQLTETLRSAKCVVTQHASLLAAWCPRPICAWRMMNATRGYACDAEEEYVELALTLQQTGNDRSDRSGKRGEVVATSTSEDNK
eukprot:658046-Prorocentrum_minimum.AAC.3